jgi:hypothetical protein
MLDPTQLFWTQIAAGVSLLLFALMLFGLVRLRSRIKESQDWLKANGEITVSEVRLPSTHTSDDQVDAGVVVRYRYGVGVQTFESECIKFGGPASMLRAHAEALAAKYPVGAKVDVHYDPQSPKDAVLEPKQQSGVVTQLVFTLVFGVIGAVLAVHAIAGKVLYTDNGVPLFAFALPGIALIVAIAGVVSFVNGREGARLRARWPTTPGMITTSDVVEETIENKGDDDKDIVRITRRYRTDLRYAYRVGQREYVGTNRLWAWTAIYGLQDQAEKAISAYPQGKSVTVYYDPARPDVAVLEPDNREGSLAPLVFGGIFAVAGALLLYFFLAIGFGH